MLRIKCPSCGERDETEFRYFGDASRKRPGSITVPPDGRDDEARTAPLREVERFVAYVYQRANPQGWHTEWWLHVGGCRRLLKVVRHTLTHQIRFVGSPLDTPASAASPSNEVRDTKP